MYTLLSASQYREELGLDTDGEDEAEEEIENVRKAWKEVQEDGLSKGQRSGAVCLRLWAWQRVRRCWKV